MDEMVASATENIVMNTRYVGLGAPEGAWRGQRWLMPALAPGAAVPRVSSASPNLLQASVENSTFFFNFSVSPSVSPSGSAAPAALRLASARTIRVASDVVFEGGATTAEAAPPSWWREGECLEKRRQVWRDREIDRSDEV